jgi:hypothetical protein
LRVARGEIAVPPPLAPYVLGLAHPVPLRRDTRALIESADVFVIEISILQDLRGPGFRFSHNFLHDQFMRGGGLGMLEWYRAVSDTPVAETIVEKAAASMREAGREVNDWHFRVLRETVSFKMSPADLTQAVKSLTDAIARPCLLVPIFTLPDAAEAHVRDRLAIRDLVQEVATDLKHGFFDSMPVIVREGRRAALAGDGVDVFHYAKSFLSVIGAELLDAAFGHARSRKSPWPWRVALGALRP